MHLLRQQVRGHTLEGRRGKNTFSKVVTHNHRHCRSKPCQKSLKHLIFSCLVMNWISSAPLLSFFQLFSMTLCWESFDEVHFLVWICGQMQVLNRGFCWLPWKTQQQSKYTEFAIHLISHSYKLQHFCVSISSINTSYYNKLLGKI